MKEENGPLIALVVFVIISVTFGILAYNNYQTLYGDHPKQKEIDELKAQIDTLDDTRKDLEVQADFLRQRIREQQSLYYLNADLYDNFTSEYQRRLKMVESGDKFEGQATELAGLVSAKKQETLQRLTKDTTQSREDMEREVKYMTDKKEEAVSRTRQLKEEFDNDTKKHRLSKNYEQSSLDDTKNVLGDLTQREVERADIFSKACGKVLVADPINGFAVIDIGTGAGVKNGYRFEAYAMHAGNQKLHKCYLEVVRADGSRSECIIIKRPTAMPKDPLSEYIADEPEAVYSPYQESGHKGYSVQPLSGLPKTKPLGYNTQEPLVEGDLIQNPFFQPGKTFNYYIAGLKEIVNERQKSAIRYRWTEIKAVIESYGGTVSPTADVNVNYVIAQKNAKDDPEFLKAVDLGLPVIYEWELFRFLDQK